MPLIKKPELITIESCYGFTFSRSDFLLTFPRCISTRKQQWVGRKPCWLFLSIKSFLFRFNCEARCSQPMRFHSASAAIKLRVCRWDHDAKCALFWKEKLCHRQLLLAVGNLSETIQIYASLSPRLRANAKRLWSTSWNRDGTRFIY